MAETRLKMLGEVLGPNDSFCPGYYRNTDSDKIENNETFTVSSFDAVFKSIGCWADSTKRRAMDSLEGKSSQLKHPYKTRVNALMKCAEVADEHDLKIFGLQNGGQCFGGKNAENTYREYGQSTECAGNQVMVYGSTVT